ncbi:MAG TPA: hypothetical protein VH092_08335, partial [Urbifossiella sp.]|nr:hypothetical protein [Urbifossiella sp.]
HFHVATSPGIDLLVGDVLADPRTGPVRELSFRLSSSASLDDLIDVLATHPGRFDRLALRSMDLSAELIRRWVAAGGLRNLHALDLANNRFGNDGTRALAEGLAAGAWTGHTLVLTGARMTEAGAKELAGCPGLASVRLLDLGGNSFTPPAAARALAASPHLAGLRVLRLKGCGLGDQAVRRLVRGNFWPSLTELDLRDNPVSDPGAKQLLAAPMPPDLTALVLSGRHLSGPGRAALARHFGPRVVIDG